MYSGFIQGTCSACATISRYLAIRIKVALSFAGIHRSNLINFGVIPLLFNNPEDYKWLNVGNWLKFPGLREDITKGKEEITAVCGDRVIQLGLRMTRRERTCLLEGGLLNLVRSSILRA